MLDASENDSAAFFRQLILPNSYSAFSMVFIRLTAHSFLQSLLMLLHLHLFNNVTRYLLVSLKMFLNILMQIVMI